MDLSQTIQMESQLRIAHDRIMQAQQKMDNRELGDQMLLEQALDAINEARNNLLSRGQYTYMNE